MGGGGRRCKNQAGGAALQEGEAGAGSEPLPSPGGSLCPGLPAGKQHSHNELISFSQIIPVLGALSLGVKLHKDQTQASQV